MKNRNFDAVCIGFRFFFCLKRGELQHVSLRAGWVLDKSCVAVKRAAVEGNPRKAADEGLIAWIFIHRTKYNIFVHCNILHIIYIVSMNYNK